MPHPTLPVSHSPTPTHSPGECGSPFGASVSNPDAEASGCTFFDSRRIDHV